MSICIAVAVPDGIALAADSQVTWNQTIIKAKEKGTGKEFELEKPIKAWRREKKVKLIDSTNPDWGDLSRDWYD